LITTAFTTVLATTLAATALALAWCLTRALRGNAVARHRALLDAGWTLVPLVLLALLWASLAPLGHA
jgi:hypothetical protein